MKIDIENIVSGLSSIMKVPFFDGMTNFTELLRKFEISEVSKVEDYQPLSETKILNKSVQELDFGSFPLSEVSGSTLSQTFDILQISNRDRKVIFNKLGLEIENISKNEIFYKTLLGILEDAPWIFILINEWVAETKNTKKKKGYGSIKGKIFRYLNNKYVAPQEVDAEEDHFDIINESKDLTLEEKFLFYLYSIEDKFEEWLEGSRESTLKDRVAKLSNLIFFSLSIDIDKVENQPSGDYQPVDEKTNSQQLFDQYMEDFKLSLEKFSLNSPSEAEEPLKEKFAKIFLERKRLQDLSNEEKIKKYSVLIEKLREISNIDIEIINNLEIALKKEPNRYDSIFESVNIISQCDVNLLAKEEELKEAKRLVQKSLTDDIESLTSLSENVQELSKEIDQINSEKNSEVTNLIDILGMKRDGDLELNNKEPERKEAEEHQKKPKPVKNNKEQATGSPQESTDHQKIVENVEVSANAKAEQNKTENKGKVTSENFQKDWLIKIVNLIEEDRLAIASRLSAAILRKEGSTILDPRVLAIAALDNINFEGYGPDLQTFNDLLLEVYEPLKKSNSQEAKLEEALLFGSLLKAAFFGEVNQARNVMSQLRLDLSDKVSQLKTYLGSLNFNFKPTEIDLDDSASKHTEDIKPQLIQRISNWHEKALKPNQSNLLAREIISMIADDDDLKLLVKKIKENSKLLPAEVKAVEEKFSNLDLIEDQIRKNERNRKHAKRGGKNQNQLQGRSLENVTRIFLEGYNSISEYLYEVNRESMSLKKNEKSFSREISEIKRITNEALEEISDIENGDNILKNAILKAVNVRIKSFLDRISSRTAKKPSTIQNIFSLELDLLPAGAEPRRFMPFDTCIDIQKKEEFSEEDERILQLCSNMVKTATPEEAFTEKLNAGAFHAATRLANEIACDENKYEQLMEEIAYMHNEKRKTLSEKIANHLLHLKMLSTIDVDFTDILQQRIDSLQLHEKQILKDAPLYDPPIAETSSYVGNLEITQLYQFDEIIQKADDLENKISQKIKEGQLDEIKKLQENSPEHASDLKILEKLVNNKDTPVQTIDDKIAQLREGVPLDNKEERKKPLNIFFPAFVEAAENDQNWPKTKFEYEQAFKGEGDWAKDLLIGGEQNDVNTAINILERWYIIKQQVRQGKSTKDSHKALLDLLGIRNDNWTHASKNQSFYTHNVEIEIKPSKKEFFVPPIFGSTSQKKFQLVICDATISDDQLEQFLVDGSGKFGPKILFWVGKLSVNKRKSFSEIFRKNQLAVLLIDEVLIAFLASYSSRGRLGNLLDCSVPFCYVQPYTTDAGKLPPEMFFGRTNEIETIVSQSAQGILVYGGRQLGKSALLHHVQAIYNNPKEGFLVVREDIQPVGNQPYPAESIWGIINKSLNELDNKFKPTNSLEGSNPSKIATKIKNWISEDPSRRLLILFDEADQFLASEQANNFPNVVVLKSLMEETNRRFKVIFAGLHNIRRTQLQPNSPLYHLGVLCVGPLTQNIDDKRSARALVEEPLRSAGYQFNKSETVDNILAWVQHYPSLIQIFMKEVVTSIKSKWDGPIEIIDGQNLFRGETFEQIQSQVRERFHFTLELDTWFQLIAACVALLVHEDDDPEAKARGYKTEVIHQKVLDWKPPQMDNIPYQSFRNYLKEMEELGVLSSQDGYYRFRSDTIRQLIGDEDDVMTILVDLADKEPKVEYDSSSYRRRINPKNPYDRFQLVDDDLNEIRNSKKLGVRIIGGLEVLGHSALPDAIRTICKEQKGIMTTSPDQTDEIYSVEVLKNGQKDVSLRKALNYSGPKKLLVVEPDESNARRVIDYCSQASSVTSGALFPIVILNFEIENHKDLFHEYEIEPRKEIHLFSITAWGRRMFRSYLQELEELASLENPELVVKILNKTGGIPNEISKFVKSFKKEKLTNIEQIEIFIEKFEKPKLNFNLDSDIEVFLDHLIDLGYDLHETTNSVEDYLALKEVLESDNKEGFEVPINKIEKLKLVDAHRPQKGKLVFSSLLKLSKEQNI